MDFYSPLRRKSGRVRNWGDCPLLPHLPAHRPRLQGQVHVAPQDGEEGEKLKGENLFFLGASRRMVLLLLSYVCVSFFGSLWYGPLIPHSWQKCLQIFDRDSTPIFDRYCSQIFDRNASKYLTGVPINHFLLWLFLFCFSWTQSRDKLDS